MVQAAGPSGRQGVRPFAATSIGAWPSPFGHRAAGRAASPTVGAAPAGSPPAKARDACDSAGNEGDEGVEGSARGTLRDSAQCHATGKPGGPGGPAGIKRPVGQRAKKLPSDIRERARGGAERHTWGAWRPRRGTRPPIGQKGLKAAHPTPATAPRSARSAFSGAPGPLVAAGPLCRADGPPARPAVLAPPSRPRPRCRAGPRPPATDRPGSPDDGRHAPAPCYRAPSARPPIRPLTFKCAIY
jgi:hypothetical protein